MQQHQSIISLLMMKHGLSLFFLLFLLGPVFLFFLLHCMILRVRWEDRGASWLSPGWREVTMLFKVLKVDHTDGMASSPLSHQGRCNSFGIDKAQEGVELKL